MHIQMVFLILETCRRHQGLNYIYLKSVRFVGLYYIIVPQCAVKKNIAKKLYNLYVSLKVNF